MQCAPASSHRCGVFFIWRILAILLGSWVFFILTQFIRSAWVPPAPSSIPNGPSKRSTWRPSRPEPSQCQRRCVAEGDGGGDYFIMEQNLLETDFPARPMLIRRDLSASSLHSPCCPTAPAKVIGDSDPVVPHALLSGLQPPRHQPPRPGGANPLHGPS